MFDKSACTRMFYTTIVMLLLLGVGRVSAQCTSAGNSACVSTECCTGSIDPSTSICDVSDAGGSCASDPDCVGNLACINGHCTDCTSDCNSSSCPGYDLCTCNPSDPSCIPPPPLDDDDDGGGDDDDDNPCW